MSSVMVTFAPSLLGGHVTMKEKYVEKLVAVANAQMLNTCREDIGTVSCVSSVWRNQLMDPPPLDRSTTQPVSSTSRQ